MRHFARENESIALGSARSASFSIAREQMPREQIPSLIAWPPFLDRSLDPFLLPLSLLPIHSIVAGSTSAAAVGLAVAMKRRELQTK